MAGYAFVQQKIVEYQIVQHHMMIPSNETCNLSILRNGAIIFSSIQQLK